MLVSLDRIEALRNRWREQVAAIAMGYRPFVHAAIIGLFAGAVAFLVMPPSAARPRVVAIAVMPDAPMAIADLDTDTPSETLDALVRRCAPTVAPATIFAIMRTESAFRPFALNVNGNLRLERAPRTAAEAIGWSSWLIAQGYSVDLGLMQINSRNLARLNLTPATVFEPCRNVRAAAAILVEH